MWTGTGLDAASFGVTSELLGYETALAFARKLPVAIRVSGTGIDFCGRMPLALPFEEPQVGRGWANGDVSITITV